MNQLSQDIIDQLRALKPRLEAEMGIVRLRVFGSVARGEAREDSDVDLIADFGRPVGLLHVYGVRHILEDETQRSIDLMTEKGIHHALKSRILEEARDV